MQAFGQQAQRVPDGATLCHERHRPKQTTPYRLAQQHAASFISHTEAGTGAERPRFVSAEFDAFLGCGILAHGFLRLRCGECNHDKLRAFTCKHCGPYPSCGARRMLQTEAHLIDHVIWNVPVRQCSLSMAANQLVHERPVLSARASRPPSAPACRRRRGGTLR